MEELTTSPLGTIQFWEKRYNGEIGNFEENGDPGDIWFGESCGERVMHWLVDNKIAKHSKILDLGCGNGMFLIELAREGFTNLHGADYSENAIILAKAVADKQAFHFINYFKQDVTENICGEYDVIHDKGTYDAVCLSVDSKDNKLMYLNNVFNSLCDDGYFIITSCNWTQHELDEQFATKFIPHEVIPTPQFKFGGKLGNLISTVIYKKKL